MSVLSNTCKYGIRAVIYLAINQKPKKKIGIKKISEELEIPAPFLGKILQTLAKNKLLNSTKGPHGGFGLAKEPHDITLYEIVNILDGDAVFTECFIGVEVCKNHKKEKDICPIHKDSGPIRQQLTKMFKEQTIGKLADEFIEHGVIFDY